MTLYALCWGLFLLLGCVGFIIRYRRAVITDRVLVYLPRYLFFLGMVFYLIGGAHGIFSLLIWENWILFSVGVLLVLIGAAAMLCQLNQNITLVTPDTFLSTSFLGRSKEYRFSECEDIQIHEDSVTLYMYGGKIHVERMAICRRFFWDKIRQRSRKATPQWSYPGEFPDNHNFPRH